MIKTLLMGPLMQYEDRWGQYARGAGDTFPQGIGCIAAWLEKNGFSADVLEPDIMGMDAEGLRAFLLAGQYDVVGISAFTTNIRFACRTAELVKGVLPKARVVLGGAHPTILPRRTMEECPAADFVITHEGERPMLRLLEVLDQGGDLLEVPNLYFRREGDVVSGEKTCGWLDLNELPLFPYHKFDMSRYVPAPSLRRVLPTVNYMAQRGCPWQCAFCDTRTHGRRVRYRDAGKVIEDLQTLKARYGIRGVVFEGSNFTADAAWVEDLCQRMIAARLGLSWYCMGRVDLKPHLLPLMKAAGLWCMSFGIESANPQTLARMNKRLDAGDAVRTLAALRKLRIRSVGSFILGYPGETEADVLRTVDFACRLGLDVAVFFIPVPFPGTRLLEDTRESGGLREDLAWEDYAAWLDHSRPIYVNPLLGPRHQELYNYAFRKFYLRPRYILKQVIGIRSLEDLRRLSRGFRSVEGLIRRGLHVFRRAA
jgi:anaerobic magnesium-protoporphyrin IX monomethyl ester cyclase